MDIKIDKKSKNQKIYYECKYCQYLTSSNKDYNKHLNTKKHNKQINSNIIIITNKENIIPHQNNLRHECICGKSYKYAPGLSYHKKSCNIVNCKNEENSKNEDDLNYKDLVLQLINQNKILQNTITDLIPKIGNNNNNINNNINIINNINFLNDKCKDAISIDEFINSIEIEVKNLINTAKNGLPIGLSNIFLEHYNNLPLIKRPLWCSDKKRKKLFIKEDEWKEDINHEKTKEAIKTLAFKQTKNTKKYMTENPDVIDNDKKKENYINIIKETTSEFGDQKQNIVINKIIDTIHLNEETKEMIQNNF
jgi:hypothetical protein